MKRIVKAARDRADIIRRRDEYRAQYDADSAKHAQETNAWRQASREILSGVEQEVLTRLGDLVEPLNIDVTAGFRWDDKVELTVQSNDHNVHSDEKALSWSWRVRLTKDGQIVKESNSWSGLKAVTEQQLSSLRMSVEALEILNSIDWEPVLSKNEPEYNDYVTTQLPKDRDREFARELDEADIENAIESGGLILGRKNSGRSYRGTVYYVVVGETPKQYKVVEVPQMYLDYLDTGTPIGTAASGWVTTSEGGIVKQWTSVQDIAEWAHQSAMIYSITKDKFFENIERPVQILS